jgi:hypothetical protein
MLDRKGQTAEAVQHLRAALAINPGHQLARSSLEEVSRRGNAPSATP